jgi:phosphosulfolactate synthase
MKENLMEIDNTNHWHSVFTDPSGLRQNKPRCKGITMVIDKGLGTNSFADLLETSTPYMDIIKIGFGTSPLYPKKVLTRKIEKAVSENLLIMPGGTFFEVAVTQGKFAEYLETVIAFGFNAIEISDGTIDLALPERGRYIRAAKNAGLNVITEYGKKCSGSEFSPSELLNTIHYDTDNGASLVTVEGRESGKGVGIYDDQGHLSVHSVEQVVNELKDPHILLWEAPHKDQQVVLLKEFGADVNLGNIAPTDVYSLESLRRGLRSDTFEFGNSVTAIRP